MGEAITVAERLGGGKDVEGDDFIHDALELYVGEFHLIERLELLLQRGAVANTREGLSFFNLFPSSWTVESASGKSLRKSITFGITIPRSLIFSFSEIPIGIRVPHRPQWSGSYHRRLDLTRPERGQRAGGPLRR